MEKSNSHFGSFILALQLSQLASSLHLTLFAGGSSLEELGQFVSICYAPQLATNHPNEFITGPGFYKKVIFKKKLSPKSMTK